MIYRATYQFTMKTFNLDFSFMNIKMFPFYCNLWNYDFGAQTAQAQFLHTQINNFNFYCFS